MTSDFYEAILFFDDNQIVKEMRYNEFEAVLDGVVGIQGLAGKKLQAAYVSMTGGLQVTACVLFVIRFDSKGQADSDWNIPLRHLASKASPGPNLGAGPIRLACKSQCPLAWYQKELWEPPAQGGFDPIRAIQRAISGNKLGLKKVVQGGSNAAIPVVSDVVGQSADAVHAMANESVVAIAAVKAQAAEKIKAMEAAHSKEKEQVTRAYRNENLVLQERVRTLEHELRENTVFHDTLKRKYVDLQKANDSLRVEKILAEDRVLDLQQQLDALSAERQQAQGSMVVNENALKDKNESLAAALQEERSQSASLREKLTQTEAERRKMVSAFVQQLQDQDLLFVAYHLGAGHISLSADLLQEYLDNPEAFAAQKCHVTLEQYQDWVSHYEMPQCEVCGTLVKRIGTPEDFVLGSHNLCEKHRQR